MRDKTREVFYRNTPELKERDEALAREAREWVRSYITERFLGTSNEELTVADLMIELDQRAVDEMPKGYVRFLDSATYPRRYAIVRTVAEDMHREGFLAAGTTVNAKGVEDVICYRLAPPRPMYRITVDPPNERIQTLIEGALAEVSDSLHGCAVLIECPPEEEEVTLNALSKPTTEDSRKTGNFPRLEAPKGTIIPKGPARKRRARTTIERIPSGSDGTN